MENNITANWVLILNEDDEYVIDNIVGNTNLEYPEVMSNHINGISLYIWRDIHLYHTGTTIIYLLNSSGVEYTVTEYINNNNVYMSADTKLPNILKTGNIETDLNDFIDKPLKMAMTKINMEEE